MKRDEVLNNITAFSSKHLDSEEKNADLIVISGLSGAGHSTVLRAFEDNGFVAIDNLPLQFLPSLGQLYKGPVAVSIDTRTLDFSPIVFISTLNALKKNRQTIKFLFLECEESILMTRYKHTRRPHPLPRTNLFEAVQEEFSLLRPLRALADEVFDTSHCSVEQTTLWIKEQFCNHEKRMLVQLASFSYRHGIPAEADLVFDGRFLRNPFYEQELKELTGKDEPVANYLSLDPLWPSYYEACLALLKQSLAGFEKRGRSYVTIAVGCTGGKHRSVFMIETLAKDLNKYEVLLEIKHRELS